MIASIEGLVIAAKVRIRISRGRDRKISINLEMNESRARVIFLFRKGNDVNLITNGQENKITNNIRLIII